MEYKIDRAGMRSWIISGDVSKASMYVAQKVQQEAERIAPVGATGHYKASFESEPVIVVTAKGEDRAGAYVSNSAEYAAAVENVHGVFAAAMKKKVV